VIRYHVRILAGRVDRGAGSHVYHQQLVRRLAARGYRVSVVCFQAVPDVRECAETFEVPLAPYDKARFVWRFTSLLQYWHCTRLLLCQNLPPTDVVVGGEHFFLRGHIRLFPETPWIYLPHSLVVDQEIKSYRLSPVMEAVSTHVYVALQRWALNNAHRTLRFSRQACEALEARYGRAIKPRFFVNPMGIEVPQCDIKASETTVVRLLWVGQLILRKRIDVALTALAKLRQYNWRFDVVGDGVARERLEDYTRQLGLTDRVQFHGFQADPTPWYRQADLLLFPSWLENFPVTMLESMSHGVPCLAMRGDGFRFHTANAEIIRHGVDGFLADSDEDFCMQLEKLLQNPQALRTAGKAARATVERQYTWDQHLDRYEDLFDELILARKRGSPLQMEARVGRPNS
jgi:glycosyltransferase involved in cell wall biosynthesis